ncbi:MAG: hypothetical protein GX957_00230 [Clostridiaceae bacterium]|nr:hypothetical protein [Clostridiaceae bacterium]
MKAFYTNKNKVLNKIEDKNNICRFITVDYPVLAEPFNVTERFYDEDFHIIEYYMDKLVCETTVENKDELLSLLGLSSNKNASEVFYTNLLISGHIKETEFGLKPTELAKKSIEIGKKVTIQATKRKFYFDAINLMPLPSEYYKNPYRIRDVENARQMGYSYILSTWNNPDQFLLKNNIKKMVGEERLKYNIPQELIDLDFDYEEFESSDENIKFTPFYIAVFLDGSFRTYDAVTEKEDTFFREILANNQSILKELYTAMGLEKDRSGMNKDNMTLSILNSRIPFTDSNLNQIMNDCFIYNITSDYVTEKINEAEQTKRTSLLWTLYTCDRVCSGDDFLGSIVYLDIKEENLNAIETFLIEYERKRSDSKNEELFNIRKDIIKSKRRKLR